jgi:NAD(P)-dependent dehydrogenase (short-subunit alcohol dehydrogenase family)
MKPRRDFKKKVVFITGAAGGLGQALAVRFGAAGARLALSDLNGDQVEALADRLRRQNMDASAWQLDITDHDACQRVLQEAVQHFHQLDVLINNAGITHRSAFIKTRMDVFRRVMDVNFFGSLHCTKASLDHLIAQQGLIIVISSIAGFAPLYGRTGYSAGKHALHGLFESLRSELHHTGVGVLMVCPGFTATNIDKNALDFDGRPSSHPQSTTGKIETPENVAQAVFDAASRDKHLLVLSRVGKLTRFLSRTCPRFYQKMMIRSLAHELERD